MHKFILIGVQGCGKGTQAKLLQNDFDMVHISGVGCLANSGTPSAA
ncbi:MAG TPA: hypothetical protein VG099_22465 [Gemmataceae bacterium]|nr:hypothetical protein [Gemmataceae bacterium]